MSVSRQALALAAVGAVCGCVGGSGSAAPKCMSGRGRVLPATPGARWQYTVTHPDTGQYTYTEDLTLGENTSVGGLVSGDAHPLCRRDGVGDQLQNWAIRWERDTGSQWQWLRNQRYDPNGTLVQDQYPQPSALRLDEDQICVGDKWTEDYELWNTAISGNGSWPSA